MTDEAIRAWFSAHHFVVTLAGLVAVGSLGSLLATMGAKSEDELAAWRAKHPGLARLGDTCRALGIDAPRLLQLAVAAGLALLRLLERKDDE